MTSLMILDSSVDYAVSAWLAEKRARSGSEQTMRLYGREMEKFRRALHNLNIDLNGDRRVIRQAAQAFAEWTPSAKSVSAGTHNLKLAVLSSFYEYCVRNELCGILVNPIAGVTRRQQDRYDNVLPLEVGELEENLNAIDRSTLDGKRDYAILVLALSTGRRIAEVAHVELKDILLSSLTSVITWPRTKGGKRMRDKLDPTVTLALLDYLDAASSEFDLASGSLWRSLAWNGTRGDSMRAEALRRMCGRRLGTTNFHRIRHTFAWLMERNGAPISEIQERLGHAYVSTTGQYLKGMRSDENPHVRAILSSVGIK